MDLSQLAVHQFSNGNMTSDGTNTYKWDAENRLVEIDYPGTGNNSQFTFDGLGRCVKIVETTSGSVTSTKQFIWCGSERCEVRDSSSALTNQYFGYGQVNVTGGTPTSYFYSRDHLGSVRETTDGSGSIQSQFQYDSYGIPAQLGGSGATPDFGFAGYYLHSRSGLNLTMFRQYSSGLGRWLSRDPLQAGVSSSLYAYVSNNPISSRDPLGLFDLGGLGLGELVGAGVRGGTGGGATLFDPFFAGPDRRAIPGHYNVPPNLQPDVWEPVVEFQGGPGYKKCIDDIYKNLKNMCFAKDEDKGEWIKGQVERCKAKFTRPTGEYRERGAGDDAFYSKYNPDTGEWEFYKKS